MKFCIGGNTGHHYRCLHDMYTGTTFIVTFIKHCSVANFHSGASFILGQKGSAKTVT